MAPVACPVQDAAHKSMDTANHDVGIHRAAPALGKASRTVAAGSPRSLRRNVLLADREEVFLLGLREALRSLPCVRCCALAQTFAQLRREITRWQPSVIVLGCGRDALALRKEIRASCPSAAQLVLLPPHLEWIQPRFGDSPIHALLPRTASPALIAETVAKMVRGETLTNAFPDGHSPRPGSTAAHLDFNVLTDREREIFRLLAQSRTYKEIGSILGISPRTVEVHRANIKSRLGIASSAALKLFSRAYLAWESTGIDQLI